MDDILSIGTADGKVWSIGPTWGTRVVHEDETAFVVESDGRQTTIYRRHVVAVVRKVKR